MMYRDRIPFPAALALVLLLCVGGCGKDDPSSPVDGESPVVTLIRPAADTLVIDTLVAEALASDNIGVTRVQYLLDGAVVATSTAAPWIVTIPLTSAAPGAHTLVAKASDATGNTGLSSAVSFTLRRSDLLYMQFKENARFVFDRWDLDMSNQKDPASKGIYTTVFTRGSGMLGGYDNWWRAISTDSRFPRKDTMIARVATTGDLQSYGFVTSILRRFIRGAGSAIDPSGIVLPAPTWDLIGRFNSDTFIPLAIGTAWDVTQSGGVNLTFTPAGVPIPITVNIKIRGRIMARGDAFLVSGVVVRGTHIVLTATISVLFNTSDLLIHVWFSDDPSGQIRLIQESSSLNLGVSTVDVPGELQELVSFQ